MIDVIHFYKVKDLNKVKTFYEKILNFKLYKDQKSCLIYDTKFGKIGFCDHFPEQENKSTCITFVYQNKTEIDALFQLFKNKNLTEKEPKINTQFNIYHFFIRDFNQIKLEFQTFL